MKSFQYSEDGHMKSKFRRGANDNVIFCTSICNNRCIMCCQPPRLRDDSTELYKLNKALIKNADSDTDYVCITGGEPTLIKDLLFKYIQEIKEKLPEADIHLLTNGRSFSNLNYLYLFKKNINVEKILIGIPLHSDNYIDHDLIAGYKGAFYETIKGLTNLGVLGYQIELRVIIMKQNYKRLPKIAEFITMNFPFVAQVAFMGLEISGFADSNYDKIWIDSKEYEQELTKAVLLLDQSKIMAYIYNIPLCLLPKEIWDYSCKSISNWKQCFLPICNNCSQKENCCGLFSTSKRYSNDIKPIKDSPKQTSSESIGTGESDSTIVPPQR